MNALKLYRESQKLSPRDPCYREALELAAKEMAKTCEQYQRLLERIRMKNDRKDAEITLELKDAEGIC